MKAYLLKIQLDLSSINKQTRYKDGKPVVLLTARVHPGETPSSHAMNGILDFLTNKYILYN